MLIFHNFQVFAAISKLFGSGEHPNILKIFGKMDPCLGIFVQKMGPIFRYFLWKSNPLERHITDVLICEYPALGPRHKTHIRITNLTPCSCCSTFYTTLNLALQIVQFFLIWSPHKNLHFCQFRYDVCTLATIGDDTCSMEKVCDLGVVQYFHNCLIIYKPYITFQPYPPPSQTQNCQHFRTQNRIRLLFQVDKIRTVPHIFLNFLSFSLIFPIFHLIWVLLAEANTPGKALAMFFPLF